MTKAAIRKVFKNHSSNPFDTDSESDEESNSKKLSTPSTTPSTTNKSNATATPLTHNEYDKAWDYSYSSYPASFAAKNRYKNDFQGSGGLENLSVQELESYAVNKSEETTKQINGCLKIAEEIREDATKTIINLHQQGEQIKRAHSTAADIDYDLSRGEKLLGSLGGLFSLNWKPKKNRSISGPVISRDDPSHRRGNHLQQREQLGLSHSCPKVQSSPRQYNSEPKTAMEKIEVEKAKQDDKLSDLSNVLGQLKDMALDMGSEIERQNKDMDHLHVDVEELNFRVRGANQRGRRLLGK